MLFAGLRRSFVLPPEMATAVKSHISGAPIARAWTEMMLSQEILIESSGEELFALSELRQDGWTNSGSGASFLSKTEGAMTVLDALSLEDLQALPKGGALLYVGDAFGGFRAYQTSTSDGRIPCSRCLVLRYLAGRGAHQFLYRALKRGARIAFPPGQAFSWPASEGCAVEIFGEETAGFDEVLPLPDCLACLARARRRDLKPGIFSPLRSLVSRGEHHAASLPQMLWLAGEETVGSGGCYDSDPERGQIRAAHEALERYAAHFTPVPDQGDDISFASASGPGYFSRKRTLLTEPGSLSTGLACHVSLESAIEHALAEVCERDALARFWLSLTQGRARLHELEPGQDNTLRVRRFLLESHYLPTVLCLGQTPNGNTVTGTAAGHLPEAAEKATDECRQNAAFLSANAELDPADPPTTFAEHLSLYWHNRRRIPDLEPFLVPEAFAPSALPAPVYHCELTPPDLALLGLHAVRVQVPGLLHLPMSHQDWPTVLREANWPDSVAPAQPHPFA